MMRFPLSVTAGGLQIAVRDRAAFLELYQTIMTPAMKAVIARARVPGATARVSAGEASFEEAVYLQRSDGAYRVTRLTVPLGARARTPGEAVARRLTFRVGRPTQVSGALLPDGRDEYVFHAVRGAFVEARLTGFPGRSILLRLVSADTGQPVDARAGAGTRVWTGRLPADADYRLEVARQPDSGSDTLIYALAVALK
ncbi:MAG: hypothetical protein R2712_25690 [Vicinamibacterales bacterium]